MHTPAPLQPSRQDVWASAQMPQVLCAIRVFSCKTSERISAASDALAMNSTAHTAATHLILTLLETDDDASVTGPPAASPFYQKAQLSGSLF